MPILALWVRPVLDDGVADEDERFVCKGDAASVMVDEKDDADDGLWELEAPLDEEADAILELFSVETAVDADVSGLDDDDDEDSDGDVDVADDEEVDVADDEEFDVVDDEDVDVVDDEDVDGETALCRSLSKGPCCDDDASILTRLMPQFRLMKSIVQSLRNLRSEEHSSQRWFGDVNLLVPSPYG